MYVLPSYYLSMPRRVRIGSVFYTIEIMDGAEAEAERVYGDVNHISQRIRVRGSLSRFALANTVMHECRHGMHVQMGLNDDSDEEDFTLLGTNAECAFAQDNPEFMYWWMNALSLSEDFDVAEEKVTYGNE